MPKVLVASHVATMDDQPMILPPVIPQAYMVAAPGLHQSTISGGFQDSPLVGVSWKQVCRISMCHTRVSRKTLHCVRCLPERASLLKDLPLRPPFNLIDIVPAISRTSEDS